MKLELSMWSVIRILLLLLGLWVLFQIRDVLVLVFLVVILLAALGPAVTWLRDKGVPRVAAALLLIGGIILGLGILVALIVPALATQLQSFLRDQFPELLNRLTPIIQNFTPNITQGQQLISNLIGQLQNVSGNVLAGLVTFFGGLVSTLTVLILTFYLLAEDKHPLEAAFLNLFPSVERKQLEASVERISDKLGAWLRGQLSLSLIIGLVAALIAAVIGIPAPLAIGVLAGILEIVPIIGPFVTGVVMVLMALISPDAAILKAVLAVVAFVVLQLAESQFLVPRVMQKAVGLSPVLVILALLVGSKLGGVAGAILAIPLAAIVQVIVEDWPKLRWITKLV